jgi:zinc protease
MLKNRVLAAAMAAVFALAACKSAPTATPTPGPGGGTDTGGTGTGGTGDTGGGTAPAPATDWKPGPPKQVTSVEGITEYALDNGMRVLLFPDQSKETVTVNVTYLVGSRHEGYGETGMAHLLEHMLFKGSPKHPKVWEELKEHGAANNATTSFDRTNYFETFPSNPETLAWALEMEADRMVNANISQEDLSSEFSVVRNEFEIGENNPTAKLMERMFSAAYMWHNYGKWPIGSRSDIERVPATRLKAFYKKYYRPDNAVLAVAGKFDAAKTLDIINATFGIIPRPPEPLPGTYTVEPPQDGERVVTLRRNGDVQVVGVLYHVSAGASEDFPAVEAVSDILTAQPSGRLYQALVKTGMATSVESFVLPLRDPGMLLISATVPLNKPLDPVREKLISTIEGLAKSKITEEEVARFRAKQKKAFKLTYTNSEEVAMELSEWAAMGDWRLMFVHRDRVEKVTVADVTKAASTYLIPSNRTLGVFVPDKAPVRAPLTEAPDVTAMVKDYKGRDAVAEGEKFEATPENIEKRTKRVTYKAGLKAAYLAKETRGDAVRAHLTLRFGTEKDLKGQRVAAGYLGRMMARGTKKHTFQQLKDEWDRLEAQVSFSSGPGRLDVTITTVRDNLPDVLALVDEVLREPSFPADEFTVVTKESITRLEEQKSDPQALAATALFRTLRPYAADHPEYQPTIEEEIGNVKALKLDAVKKQHAWLGASDATFTIVGDFDAALIEPWVERTWGTWKSPKPFKRVESKYFETKPGDILIDTPDKENALLITAYALPMRDDDPDYPALMVANYALGGGQFVSRLLTRLRQKDGLSYFAGSAYQADSLDKVAFLITFAASAPGNAPKAMAAMIDELEKFAKDGITAEELKTAKEAMSKDFQRAIADDDVVMETLHEGLYLGRTFEFEAKQQKAIADLTLDQVNAAIKKYVKPGALVKVIGGDKKKMEGGK